VERQVQKQLWTQEELTGENGVFDVAMEFRIISSRDTNTPDG
jgi:hypothetical protein